MDVFPPCALTIPVSVLRRQPKVGIVPTGAVAFDLIDGQHSPGLLVVDRCAHAEQTTCVAANTTSCSDFGRGKTILLLNGSDISNKSYT